MKKNKLSQVDIYKGVRKKWAINPRTRVKPSKKIYNRQLTKQEIRKIKQQEEF